MSAIMSGNNFYSSDSQSPNPTSPASPTKQSMNQSSIAPRSFINLTHSETRTSKPPLQMKQQYTLMDPPPGMTYAEFICTWTDSQVARWLTDIKCGCHDETFKANDIRGDVILELDQASLKEIGVASIGDRLRILNAVKILRQRVASRSVTPPSIQTNTSAVQSDSTSKSDVSINRSAIRRLEMTRPAPLQLNANANRGDLPALIREQAPDSARSVVHPIIRPLPQPNQSTPPSNSTPSSSAHSATPGLLRPNLPPLPPPPRGQPPLPPTRNTTRAPAYISQSQPQPQPPQNQGHLTPSGSWVNHHLPSDPRPGNPGGKVSNARSISPVPPARLRSHPPGANHGRNGSVTQNPSNNAPTSKLPSRPTPNAHPYASVQPALHPPTATATHLSPIEESFSTQQNPAPSTPSPPMHAYTVGRGPFNPTNSAHNAPYSLSDLRRKLVKFVLPDEGLSFTIDVATCNGGIEVLERVLKKFDKGSLRSDDNLDISHTDDGGLTVDGWGVFMEMEIGSGTRFFSYFHLSLTSDFTGQPLTEAELLSICLAPDHPTREHGLIVRRVQKPEDRNNSPSVAPSTSITNTKRASFISILSGLGVHDPERALDPPSPTSGRLSPAIINAKRPSKLRNFFGQRPPSELITNHLTEYFPNAEKKVLERTARHSMMIRSGTILSKRHSTSSNPPLPSRFSSSTQGSARRSISPPRPSSSTLPPPVPEKVGSQELVEDLPRMSLSTEDGRSVDLLAETPRDAEKPQLLPPMPFPTESLSESMEGITGDIGQRPVSRAMSITSQRMSYMTELRSKRDRSDTASVMTVGEITAEVESRRASTSNERETDLDDWTKVDADIGNIPRAVESDEEEEEEEEEEEDLVDEEDETLHEEDELGLDVDDHGRIRNIMSARRGMFIGFMISITSDFGITSKQMD